MANYYIALAEVNEILNYVENKYISKIPTDILEIIRTYKIEPCIFRYDLTKSLSEQECHKETFELLSYINYNFWLDEKEKDNYKKIYYNSFIKIEDEKREKYNPDNIFKVKNETNIDKEENLPVLIKDNTNFFVKIIRKLIAIIK